MIAAGVLGWILGIGVPFLHVLGGLSAIDAVMKTRTPQGATAWAVSLVTFPYLALPLYWIFGRFKFDDYLERLSDFNQAVDVQLTGAQTGPLANYLVNPKDRADLREQIELRGFRELATLPFTRGNGARLLVDGQATFEALFASIDAATTYVFAQFYIIHDDAIGTQFQQHLIDAAKRGVRVYLLYDAVGSYKLPGAYKRALEKAGVSVAEFSGNRSLWRRFRLNFRNHRKIVVVDGTQAFIGGLNVGDEYLGRDPEIGAWRDTHLAVEGPIVQGIQLSFLRDWYYGEEDVPEAHWTPTPSEQDQCALVLASGPADELETCGLLYTHAIESAEERVWLATPYFVPDGRVLGALQLAALRGVDVRVLMPRTSDSWMFKYVPYAYLPEVEQAGVQVWLYEEGFMHQKVLLVDDDYAAIGTANFDNRSFRLNFELTTLVNDAAFCGKVEAMLDRDFARATRLTGDDLNNQSALFRFATQGTRLLAPVL
ncbi:MAG: cardiolipin synthase [Rhodothermaceae bacterium]|nr:cardiolipin synthase [Rhodothermaceae bacterium]